jgi:hypothetical protein
MSDTEDGNQGVSHTQGAAPRGRNRRRDRGLVVAMVALLAAVGIGGWLLGEDHGQDLAADKAAVVASPTIAQPTLLAIAATPTATPVAPPAAKAQSTQATQAVCASIPPIAGGATSVTQALGDFAGDGTPNDVLKVYHLGSAWHVRVDIGGQGVSDHVLSGAGPMTAIGATTVNNDAIDEAWVKVSSGAGTDVVGLLAFHNCNLQRVYLNNAPAAFAIGSTVTADDGLSCFGFNVGVEVFATTSGDGVTYNGTSKLYTLNLASTTPKLVLGSTASESQTTSSGPAYTSLHTFHCHSLNTIP